MTNRSYLNFDISIERTGEHYRAHVVESCAGEGNLEFELPFSEYELENFILKMGHARRSTGRSIHGFDSPEMIAAKQFGGKLFETVFKGDIYACLRASLDEAHSQGQGVRVLLRLAPELADIPWEYLYNPAWNQFFALSTDTPLVRYLELTPPIFPLPVKSPLCLLAVISSPSDYQALDVEREWQNLQEALKPLINQSLIEVDRLESASLLTLQRQLRRREYHIFHFIGHGSFEESAQDGLLLFTDEIGRGKPLSGQYLGTLLRDHHTLRLAVLNACEGARSGREDPFAGVALSLVQMGLPAVIAMQFEISDSAAIMFAQEFYTALADGYPVDAALADARKAIFASSDSEWGTPVLFSRAMDGRIFELTRSSAAQAAPEAKESAPQTAKASQQKKELEANRLYEDGLSAFYLEDWQRAQECFMAALKRQPDHPAATVKLAYAQRQFELSQRYELAQGQLATQDWVGALQTLEQLDALSPQYRDTASLLQSTRKRGRLAELYSDATRLSQAEQWSAVINIFEQMNQLEADCPDPHGLLVAAKNALAEAEQQKKLAEIYSHALQAMDAQNWREARQLFVQVGRIQADYRDTARLLEKTKAEIANQSAAAKRPAKPAPHPLVETEAMPQKRWWLTRQAGIIGGLILLGSLAVLGILFAQSLGWFSNLFYKPTIKTDAHGVQVALIPAGSFRMGSEYGESDEIPVHTVNITKDFYMDVYEVTNAAYQACVTARQCDVPSKGISSIRSSYYSNVNYANYPVLWVSWENAETYCKWRGGRLPTEAQWEYAARGRLQSKRFPWGGENPVCTVGAVNGANYSACGSSDTGPVGSYAPNGYGLYDMAGNVWEWVHDYYRSRYYSYNLDGNWPDNPIGPVFGEGHVLRGGGWRAKGEFLRVANRSGNFSAVPTEYDIGFRCAIPVSK